MSVLNPSPTVSSVSHRTSNLTLAAGALFLVVPLLVELVAGDAFALMGLALFLLVVAIPGLRRLQGGRDGRLGRMGVRLAPAGLLALVLLVVSGDLIDAAVDGSVQEVVEAAYMATGAAAVLATLVGVLCFSLGMTRARVLSSVGIWVFLAGVAGAFVSEAFEQSLRGPVPWLADVLPPAGFMVAGLGLVLMGRSARRVEDHARHP